MLTAENDARTSTSLLKKRNTGISGAPPRPGHYSVNSQLVSIGIQRKGTKKGKSSSPGSSIPTVVRAAYLSEVS